MATQNITTRINNIVTSNRISGIPFVSMNDVYSKSLTTPSLTSSNLTTSGLKAAQVLTAVTSTAKTAASQTTLTASDVLSGLVIIAGALGAGFEINLPTAASIVSAIGSTAEVGYAFKCTIVNKDTTQVGTLTSVARSEITVNDPATIATATSTTALFLLTNVTPGSEAITVQQC